MKEFDYEAAKAGAKVQTRDGRPARIICWDRRHQKFPIIALVDGGSSIESTAYYTLDGRFDTTQKTPLDLIMVQDMGKDRKTTLQRLHARAKKMAYSEELRQYEGVALEADGSFEFGYMVGAYQQMELDIDKACEWLNEQLYTDDGGCLSSGFYQELDDFFGGVPQSNERTLP